MARNKTSMTLMTKMGSMRTKEAINRMMTK